MKIGPDSAPQQASPSQQVIDRASETFEVTDARGRRIFLKRPDIIAEYNFVEMLGEAAANQTWLSMVMPLTFIVRIDDEDVPPIARKSEVKAMLKRLDRDGLEALARGIKKNFPELAGGEVDREAVKD